MPVPVMAKRARVVVMSDNVLMKMKSALRCVLAAGKPGKVHWEQKMRIMIEKQEVFDFRPPVQQEGLTLQCPAEKCRKTFTYPKTGLVISKGMPLAQCPGCRVWFEVKAHGENGYHTLVNDDI